MTESQFKQSKSMLETSERDLSRCLGYPENIFVARAKDPVYDAANLLAQELAIVSLSKRFDQVRLVKEA